METSNKRVVAISNWYLFTRLIFRFFIFSILFLFFYGYFYISDPGGASNILKSMIFPGVFCLIYALGDLFYWSKSGILVNDQGDHVVKIGGWVAKEDKLLNGVIISNQVTRGPIDQLFGMGTIETGISRNGKLSGVRYKNIIEYDNLMRSASPTRVNSIF